MHKSVQRMNPPSLWDMAANGYSQISIADGGRLAFLSGQVATQVAGGEIPVDLARQAELVARNLQIALNELEASARDVVMIRMYVVGADNDRFLQALKPLEAMLGEEMPSITTIGVQSLFTPDIQVEIEMVVNVP